MRTGFSVENVNYIGTLRQRWKKLVGIVQKWPDKIRILWTNKENLNIQLETVDPVFAAECRCCAYPTPGGPPVKHSACCSWGQRS